MTRWWCWPRRSMRKKHPISTPHRSLQQSLIVHQHSGELGKMVRGTISTGHGSTSASALPAPMSFEAARMGLGFILESKMMATDHLKDGSLVQSTAG